MKRLLSLAILFALLLAGCGTVKFAGFVNTGNVVAASGTVSIVRLTFASDENGNSITVTGVTLIASGTAQNLTFCGTQTSRFPMNSFVTTRFTPGASCSTLISVVIN